MLNRVALPRVFDDDDADVVARTLRERSLDQSIGRCRYPMGAGQYLGDFRVTNGAAEAVRTKQQNIA